jgi:hypothetical protein
MPIRTVFLMAEECARGEHQGWREFVRDYGTIAQSLLRQYFPMVVPDLETHTLSVFQRARSGDNDWFQKTTFSNEREFLMCFRDLLFSYAREVARVPVPQLSLRQIEEIMKDLSVVEREMLWLYIKGYSNQQITTMMMNAAATSEAVKKVADDRLSQVLPGSTPDAFNISARVLLEQAEKSHTEQCLPVKTFNNLVNGQITWRERELAEEHIKGCFYCVDRFTAFQEMGMLRKSVPPLDDHQVESVLAGLNLPPERNKGLFSRLLTKS